MVVKDTSHYHILGKFAGISFGDFGQNVIFINLASFRFDNSGP